MGYLEDLGQKVLFVASDASIMVRRIDCAGLPDNLELTVTYWDEDEDGQIEKVISKEAGI